MLPATGLLLVAMCPVPALAAGPDVPATDAQTAALTNAASLYVACRGACRDGRLDAAERLLLEAIKAGFDDFSRLRRDAALVPLRDRSMYRAILAARDAADPVLARRAMQAWQDRLDDPRYTVESDAERRLNLLSPLTDRARRELRGSMAGFVDHLGDTIFQAKLRHAVLIVLLAPDDAHGIFPHRQIRGVYRHPNRTLIALEAGRALRHELVHALHHSDMDARGQDHATWILEGLAGAYERFTLDAHGQPIFAPNDRDELVRRMAADDRLIDWSAFLAMGHAEFEADAARTYAQARSIMRFIAERHGLEPWYEIYVTDHDLDETGRLALESVFARPLDEIEADWRAWIAESTSRRLVMSLGRDSLEADEDDGWLDIVPTPAAAPSPPRTVARSLHLAAQEAYAGGDFDRAGRLLRRVLELEPSRARARYELGLVAVRRGDLPAAQAHHAVLARQDPSLASLLGNLVDAPSRERPRSP
ncbi:MAG: tetratricopeptide repeat protein [Planctomycetota bacterium]|jgi:hypothetical protein